VTERESVESWEPMRLRYVGDVGDVVKMDIGEPGQGKTGVGHDPGDDFKPPGQG
jgi:hypothetical protein